MKRRIELPIKTDALNGGVMFDGELMEIIADYINNNEIVVTVGIDAPLNIMFDEFGNKINISIPGTVEYDGEKIYVVFELSEKYHKLIDDEDYEIGINILMRDIYTSVINFKLITKN